MARYLGYQGFGAHLPQLDSCEIVGFGIRVAKGPVRVDRLLYSVVGTDVH